MGVQAGGVVGALGGAGQGGDAAPVLDLRVPFKCLTCDLKECKQTEAWIRIHKINCRALQKGRQQEQHKKAAEKKGAPIQPKNKKGSAPPQPKPKGSGAKKASNQPKPKKR